VDGRALLIALDLEGIASSIGSACSSRSARPSPALLAMGFSESEARAAVRFSFGPDAEVAVALDAADRVARVFRALERPELARVKKSV
jgi:cysteine desulfurase